MIRLAYSFQSASFPAVADEMAGVFSNSSPRSSEIFHFIKIRRSSVRPKFEIISLQ